METRLTNHKDLGGGHFAGSCDLTGEEASELVGRLYNCFVASDVGH